MSEKENLVSKIRDLFANEDEKIASLSQTVQSDNIEKAIFELIEKTKTNSLDSINSDEFPNLRVKTKIDLIESDSLEVTDITTADSIISPEYDLSPMKINSGGKIVRPPQSYNVTSPQAQRTIESPRRSQKFPQSSPKLKEPMTMEEFRNLNEKKNIKSNDSTSSLKVKQGISHHNPRSENGAQKPIEASRNSLRRDYYQKSPIKKEPMSFKLTPDEMSTNYTMSPIKDIKPLKIDRGGQNHFEKTTESYRNHLKSKPNEKSKSFNRPVSSFIFSSPQNPKKDNESREKFKREVIRKSSIGEKNDRLALNKKSDGLELKELRKLSVEEGGVCFKARPIIKKDQYPCRSVQSPPLTQPHSPKFNTLRRSFMKSINREK